MMTPSGAVKSADGLFSPVVGRVDAPGYLNDLEPLAVVPRLQSDPGQVSVLVLVASHSKYVDTLTKAVSDVLGVDDPTSVQILTSDNLSQLRAAIQGQLGSYGRELTLVIFAITGILTAGMLYAFVTAKRKDFGRRRALGASRGMIFALVTTQTGLLAAIGIILGCAGALVTLSMEGSPLPGVDFTAAVATLALGVSVGAATLPALSAAQRDPIRELRVP